jgi:hypothetical protein
MTTRKAPADSAKKYTVGTRKVGMNGNNWIIKQNKNKVKRWVKINKTNEKEQEKKKELTNLLKKIGVTVHSVNNKLVRGMYIQNYPWDVVREKYEKKSREMLDDTFIIIVHEGDLIQIQHNNIKGKIKKELIQIFKQIYKNKFSWNEKTTGAMFIKN